VKCSRAEHAAFYADRRNIAFSLCIDAFNPHNSGSSSVTPFVVSVLNLDPKVWNSFARHLQFLIWLLTNLVNIGWYLALPSVAY
jgi:hypothetical protein